VSRFVEESKKLVVGDPKDPKTNIGALVSKQHREKVEYYINLAKEEGGNMMLKLSGVDMICL
jgi:aminomuconate-semialdehyde/2-hydroxymuconate-6-semialdehyde dehydrogenase